MLYHIIDVTIDLSSENVVADMLLQKYFLYQIPYFSSYVLPSSIKGQFTTIPAIAVMSLPSDPSVPICCAVVRNFHVAARILYLRL
jgi:hypothetical protein